MRICPALSLVNLRHPPPSLWGRRAHQNIRSARALWQCGGGMRSDLLALVCTLTRAFGSPAPLAVPPARAQAAPIVVTVDATKGQTLRGAREAVRAHLAARTGRQVIVELEVPASSTSAHHRQKIARSRCLLDLMVHMQIRCLCVFPGHRCPTLRPP